MDAAAIATIKETFKRFDVQGTGTISRPALAQVLKLLKVIRSETEHSVDRLVEGFEADEEGKVRYDEFLDWLLNNEASTGGGGFPPGSAARHIEQSKKNIERELADARKEVAMLHAQLEEVGRKNSKNRWEPSPLRRATSCAQDLQQVRSGKFLSTAQERGSRRKKGSHYDLVVLGGGPVGYKAAIEAASRGQYVAVLDAKGEVTGLPTGAHSKCLREAAVDGAKTWADVDEVLQRAFLSKREDAAKDLKTYNVDELTGFGTVLDAERVRFAPKNGDEPREIHFDTLLIATGSKANRFPPLAPFFDKLDGLFDSDTIGNIDYLPKRVVVQGAGIIGLEYAQIFRKMGSQVTIVEFADKAVQMLDVSLQEACLDTMKQIGVPIHFKTVIKTVVEAEGHTAASPSLLVEIVDGETLPCDCLLSATGRSGWTTGLGLENLEPLGLKIGRGRMIQADDDGATGVPNVFAAGDVAGANLATVGMAQATRFVRSVFGSGHKHKTKVHKPYGVWTIPEIAAVGLNEQDAQKDYPNLGVARAEYKQTVRGCVTSDQGFLKIIYNRDDGVVLGVHIIGENACDIINYGAEVVNDEDTIFDMLQFVFPAVTFHQLYHFAATDAVRRLKGARNLAADAAWKRLQVCIKKSIGVESTADALAEAFQIAFEQFDLDKSGFIKPNELKTAMDNMGLNSSPEEVSAMLEEVTGDPTITYVDYDQFMTHMMKQIG